MAEWLVPERYIRWKGSIPCQMVDYSHVLVFFPPSSGRTVETQTPFAREHDTNELMYDQEVPIYLLI